MARYNNVVKNTRKTETYEGGTAWEKSLENEWVNMIFSSVLLDGFYEKGEDRQKTYIDLTEKMIEKYGPDFVSKAAVFVRNELGMRTISELTAALLNKYKFDGKRNFYRNYFHRPDGVGEVFGAIQMLGDKRSHAFIRGCADYLSTLDEYQLDKYNMRNHQWTMLDLINITHATSPQIDKLKQGKLEKADTWENKTKHKNGKTLNAEERAEEFVKLVESGKMGYIALIRNLNNILKSDKIDIVWVENYLVTQLIDPVKIHKSMVFPYQIYVAFDSTKDILPTCVRNALSKAFRISCKNMNPIEGTNAIVLDVSASMGDSWSTNSHLSIGEVSAVYAAALYLMQNGNFDIYKFGAYANKFSYNRLVDPFTLIDQLRKNDECGHATNLANVFEVLDKKYDNIFLFSDMQVCDPVSDFWNRRGSYHWTNFYNGYKNLFKANPMIFSFDLGNYHTQSEPDDNKIKYITTVSDKVFEIINYLQDNNRSLIDVIKDYSY